LDVTRKKESEEEGREEGRGKRGKSTAVREDSGGRKQHQAKTNGPSPIQGEKSRHITSLQTQRKRQHTHSGGGAQHGENHARTQTTITSTGLKSPSSQSPPHSQHPTASSATPLPASAPWQSLPSRSSPQAPEPDFGHHSVLSYSHSALLWDS
jgi:hypothetical protein